MRTDVSYIRIGEASNVQDVACLHVADEGLCIIGNYVMIGHGAIVHACTVGDNVLIGMNATVLTGALVKENDVIPPNSLVVGVSGEVKKQINRVEAIHAQAVKYKTAWALGYGVAPHIGGELYHGEQIV